MIISKQNYHVFDESDCIWRKNDINNEAIEFITEYLEPNKSWSDKIQLLGCIDSTCVEICNYDDGVEIQCRLDLRTMSKLLLEKTIEFIALLGGRIYYTGNVYTADIDILLELIIDSDSAKFCTDYKKFLNEITDVL